MRKKSEFEFRGTKINIAIFTRKQFYCTHKLAKFLLFHIIDSMALGSPHHKKLKVI